MKINNKISHHKKDWTLQSAVIATLESSNQEKAGKKMTKCDRKSLLNMVYDLDEYSKDYELDVEDFDFDLYEQPLEAIPTFKLDMTEALNMTNSLQYDPNHQERKSQSKKERILHTEETYSTPTSNKKLFCQETKSCCIDETFRTDVCYDSKYKQFSSFLLKDDALHYSNLGGHDLRASLTLICESSEVSFLIIWKVSTSKEIDIEVVPITRSKDHSTNNLLDVCQEIRCIIVDTFSNEKQEKATYEDLFRTVTSLVLDSKERIGMYVLSNLGESAKQASKKSFAKMFESMVSTPNLNVELAQELISILDASDKADRLESLPRANMCKDTSTTMPDQIPEVCIVCFDTLEAQSSYHLSGCKHVACVECWEGLIKAARSSGASSISCPGYKCRAQKLSKRDSAHILFEKKSEDISATSMIEKVDIFNDLIQYRMEKYMMDNTRQVVHCTTPACTGLFTIRHSTHSDVRKSNCKGGDIQLCSCGTSLCIECGKESHAGLRCSESEVIQNDIKNDTLLAEAQTTRWLESNSKPCPKCGMRISKAGGCLHMTCRNCNSYFCWICGGDGAKCGFYRCQQMKIDVYKKDTDLLGLDDNSNFKCEVELVKFHRKINTRFEKMTRENAANSSHSDAFDLYLLQMMLWSTTLRLYKRNKRSDSSLDSVVHCNDKMKTLYEALYGENRYSVDELERVITANEKSPVDPQLRNFLRELGPSNLFTYLSLFSHRDTLKSSKTASTILRETQETFAYKGTRSRLKKKDLFFREAPLNKREKRKKEGWKSKKNDEEDDIVDMSGSQKVSAWKGRNIVNTRRYL